MIEQILSPELIHALGWTLVHTLWQGALFAVVLGLLLVLLRKFSARARYNVAIGLLCAFFLTASLSFYQFYSEMQEEDIIVLSTGQPEVVPASTKSALPVTAAQKPNITSVAPRPIVSASFSERFVNYYNQHLPLIVTLWLMGVLVLQLRFLGQLAYVQRLKNYGTERFPTKWAVQIQELETRLNISRPVRYLTSFRVNSPLTLGWLNPVVLFPPTLLAELKASQVVTILAHELAHVKRNDFVVNMVQTLLCTLFFFHPATWWMSARINEEREHCCDDLAIEVTGEAVGYAKTLLRMKEEELKTDGVLAMAFRGKEAGGFNYRIRRLVSGYLNGATYGEGLVTALILVAALGTAVAASDGDKPSVAVNETPNLEQTSVVEDGIASTALPAETMSPSTTKADVLSSGANPMDDERETSETEGAYADWTAINGKRIKSGSPLVLPDSLEFPFLMEAAEEGNHKLVEYFLTKKIDLNQTDRNGWTPLMVATSEDHVKVVRLLIGAGADVNYVNRHGWTALIEAADEGAIASARVLLEAGAKTDLPGNSLSAADMAASEGHSDVLRLLAEKGADLTGKGRRTSPMHEAAEEGKLSIVRNLLEAGLAIDVKDENGRTPLSYAAEEGKVDVVSYLLRNGANVDVKDNNGRDAMSYAAEEGKIDVLRMLKLKGGKVMSGDEKGMTPLHYAAEEGNTKVLRAILKSGTDPDVRTRNGHTPLHYAVAEDELEVIRLLLDAGADVNAKDAQERRVLLYASEDLMDEYHPNAGSQWNNGPRKANWEVIGVLIKAGAISGSINGKRETLLEIDGEEGAIYLSEDGEELIFQVSGGRGSRSSSSHSTDGSRSSHHDVFEDGTNSHHDSFGHENEANEANKANERNPSNSRNNRGNESVNNSRGNVSSGEPLVSAVRNGENRKIDQLIRGGANVDGIGRNGRTPLTEASFHNYNIHTRQLVKGGADINKRDADGYTPLTMAVEHNHFSTVEHLLELGADPDQEDRNGTSAKSIALRDNYPNILRLLNEAGGNITAVDRNGTSPLTVPAREGNLESIRYLLEQGADPNGGNGCPPIFLAAREGHPKSTRLLAQYKADLEKGCDYRDTDYYYRAVPGGGGSVADYQGAGPLMAALTQTDGDVASVLLQAGANVNATCRKARYNSPREISWRESENLRKQELASRFDTQYDVSGWTPLMEAVESGKLELVQLLLKAGANKTLVAGGGLSARQLAEGLGDTDIIAALR